MELLRRVLLVIGLLLAIGWALTPEPALVAITTVDFAQDQLDRPRWEEARRLTLNEFIAERTKDRVLVVQSESWKTLMETMHRHAAGDAMSASWARRLGQDYLTKYLYFRTDEPPVNEVADKVAAMGNFGYLCLETGGQSEYLALRVQSPGDAKRSAPSLMLYPMRHYAIWPLLVGLALYLCLPRAKNGPRVLRYSRSSAGLLPDLVGTLLVGVFFALPLVIIPANSPTGKIFDGDWIMLVVVCWGFAGFGLVIFVAAAWYSSLRIVLLDDRFRRVTAWGASDYLYSEVSEARMISRGASRVLIWFGFLTSLLNWRALGPALLLAGRSAQVLEIRCRDGQRVDILLDSLPSAEHLLEALARNGISVLATSE